MFDNWRNHADAAIYRPMDRPVEVLATGLWSSRSANSLSLAPWPVRERGLQFAAFHPGRQIAWVRLSFGTWLAVVEVNVTTADGANSVRTVLWLEQHQFRLPPARPY